MSDPELTGAAWYSRRNLRLYELVLRFNHRVFWRCPRSRLVELYDDNVSARHLDIGVADGSLLDHCRFPVAAPELTLLDLNPYALAVAPSGLLATRRPRSRGVRSPRSRCRHGRSTRSA